MELTGHHFERKFHCFHCCKTYAAVISGIKVYDWLIFLEFYVLSEIELFITDWTSSKQYRKCRVCFPCNGNSTNWSIVENNIFLNKLISSGSGNKRLYQSLLVVVVNGSKCKYVRSFLVIIKIRSNTTSVKQTISNSTTNVRVVTNHV